ncbi:uncharacterized protein L3040_002902 [Drepanopeziza brunnea f. sp. 'multigermtubi']|uniref:FAD binding domain-containing protein n=1 Tax=Marssonina brunnea f. sp. multigermtubi (strain MB_m1) TaxID=1072389 RepID=K1X9I3_MARBU|nr:FAD binding domain-containing protein [Drepanopeziza brunnea f. sp. 'multigermtubi' MB_m1]EKD17403.1 FAD binding domain-containing protein [Drepanopeziza brunnea f. sp. 'multigermtubi' MB_m1]KAJ5047058.1 hypothetical protein L3040_002902 [Drepanopeziza brunnea f. sp. 'multigermtubi']
MPTAIAQLLLPGLFLGLPCLAQYAYGAPSAAATCETISSALPGKVENQNSSIFKETTTYWSARQDLTPGCVVLPTCAEDVAKALVLVTNMSTPFTVKSGGHSGFDAASSIQGGVLISLEMMNSIEIADDLGTVAIGPGNRWINVTQAVEPHGIAVVGGRSPLVGVSGFLLGGGLSFLLGKRGLGCDNIRNFQVALVSGEIVDANPSQNPDLYWALRGGGGSSFGIVTRFDLEAYEQGDIWSRLSVWTIETVNSVLHTFTKVAREMMHSGLDPDAHMMFGINFAGPDTASPKTMVFGFHLNLSSPYAPGGEFDTMASFGDPALPGALLNTSQVMGLSDTILRTTSAGGGFGNRESWYSTSISDRADSDAFMDKLIAAFTTWGADVRAQMTARGDMLNMSMVFQPLTNPALEAMQRNGGNPTGLRPKEFPTYIVSFPTSWSLAANDDFLDASMQKFVSDLDAMAKADGCGAGYEYMNYAGKFQSRNGTVIASYGPENQERLRAIAKKYDPQDQLRTLWTGYHKP